MILEHSRHDITYALRALRRAPLFTVIVAVTLSLGIGANAAVISAIDTMFLRRLPVPNPERIVAIYKLDRRDFGRRENLAIGWSSAPLYREVRAQIAGVEGLAAYGMQTFVAGDALAGESVWGAFVSGNYFSMLGVAPERGRFIRPDEEETGVDHSVIVISDHLWREKFAADDRVLGRTIPIGKGVFTIVGVAPPNFTGLHPEGRTDLWMPYAMADVALGRGSGMNDRLGRPMMIFGRLKEGATVAQVQGSAEAVARELARRHPDSDTLLAFRVAVRDRLTTLELSTNGFVWMVFSWLVIALLHLVACSNVASLMLARASARRRELGIRVCLGASRARILMQSLTEAGILSALGGIGGLVVGRWLSSLIASVQFMSASDTGLDWRIVAIVVVVTAASVLQFGLVPALDASRSDPLTILRGAGAVRYGRHSRSEMVVVFQIAISTLLIANAIVFLDLLRRQATTPLGFDADHLVVASVDVRGSTTRSVWRSAYDEVMVRVSSVPGVRAASAALGAPLFHTGWLGELSVPGRVPSPNEQRQFLLQAIGPGYFATIGAPLVRGREFTRDEEWTPGTTRLNLFTSVIVNEALARRLWPGEDALGKQLTLRGSPPATVVGIVRDLRDVSTVDSRPRAYFPMLQFAYPSFEVLMRVDDEPSIAVTRIASALGGSIAFARPTVRTMPAIRDAATSTSRTGSAALSVCGAVALLLTSVGLYGLVAMWAARRRAEIGIRLALGASKGHVHGLLLSAATRLVGVGIVIGLVCAFGLVRVEQSWLGPIIALGPTAMLATTATFALIAGVAAALPTWRATRQPPAEVLRTLT